MKNLIDININSLNNFNLKLIDFKNNIFCIENFISKNELKDLFELINNSPKNWDDQEHLKNMKKDKEKYNSFWSNRLLIIENNSTMKSINDRIHSLFDLKKYEVHKFSKIMRYFPGDSLALHNDDGYSKEKIGRAHV